MSNDNSELPIVGECYWIVYASNPQTAVVIASGNGLVAFRTNIGVEDVRCVDDWKEKVISRYYKPRSWWKIWQR
jgi:hypothetical protein